MLYPFELRAPGSSLLLSRGKLNFSERRRRPVASAEETDKLKLTIGLCADCEFMRQIKSDRGSTFYLCRRSDTQPEFPKYPRLPVIRCTGYSPIS